MGVKPTVESIARDMRRLITKANRAGLAVVVDGDGPSIRVMTVEEANREDLRGLGERVSVDNGCGSHQAKVSGGACNYGNL